MSTILTIILAIANIGIGVANLSKMWNDPLRAPAFVYGPLVAFSFTIAIFMLLMEIPNPPEFVKALIVTSLAFAALEFVAVIVTGIVWFRK